MARKTARSKHPKSMDPSFRSISKAEYFPVQKSYSTTNEAAGPYTDVVKFLDTARALSEVNSRLYRRNRLYTLNVQLNNDAPAGDYEVWVLQNTWNITKAFQEGLAAYNTAVAEERTEILKGQSARWFDFTPANGVTNEALVAALGSAAGGTITNAARNDGEHQDTVIYDEAGASKFFTWSPFSSAARYSLMAEYDAMGQTDTDPQVTELGGYVGLVADSDPGNIANLQGQGNNPPYANPTFATNYWVRVAVLQNSGTGSQRLSTGMFEAPCGFVWIKAPTPTSGTECTVVHKSGSYKGVHALSMGA